MEIVTNGILSGLVLSFLFGPVFFTILQTSLERGFFSGLLVAVGVCASDACFIGIAYWGFEQFLDDIVMIRQFAIVGGTSLIVFGAYYLLFKSRRSMTSDMSPTPDKKPIRYVLKGFILNGLSPLVLAFWIGTVGFATAELGYQNDAQVLIFFGVILLTVLSTDILKARLADKLRTWITPRFVRIINTVLGIIFLTAGIKLLFFLDDVMTSFH